MFRRKTHSLSEGLVTEVGEGEECRGKEREDHVLVFSERRVPARRLHSTLKISTCALERHHRAPGTLRARTQRRRAFRVPGLARACPTPSRILSAHRLRTDEAGVGPVKLLNLDADRALGGTAVLLTIWVWMLHVPHRHMNLRAALLASAPLPVVWTYTRPSALLVCAPLRLGRD